MYSPFPEEFNRKTISSMATYHFAPTENNRRNLLNEGMDNSRIFVTSVSFLRTSVGTLNQVASSCIPPESVNINFE
jgi:UDP-N-acetylglucosamine 2-epimerase (non-hydrolysing)